ncbi:hypothetical protein PBRA_001976 [Plasmodiophora brassicae]|uniref:Uncharacterized protein n=1 Tax=Plasmodiophora brassicae TaxID=37360 RepID=A0A0G4J1B7_PLABS|nr:hypothetical protein PBRA_001976 [Plasmodiophora brassicae]
MDASRRSATSGTGARFNMFSASTASLMPQTCLNQPKAARRARSACWRPPHECVGSTLSHRFRNIMVVLPEHDRTQFVDALGTIFGTGAASVYPES